MTRFLVRITMILLGVTGAKAATESIQLNTQSMQIQKVSNRSFGEFSQLSFAGFENSRIVGAPELPVKSVLLVGTPQSIQVNLDIKSTQVLENIRPVPVQPQDCRCEVKRQPFQFDSATYLAKQPAYALTYLGAFRGTPVTRLDINLGSYESEGSRVILRTKVNMQTNASEYSFAGGDFKDYLIIGPENLIAGVNDFVAWKTSQGYNVIVEPILAPANDLASISALIKNHYQNNGTDFVIILGDDATVPMFKVKTSGSSSTPSDLTYFTMDGADDYIPDMFYSRIAATTPEQVTAQLAKSIEFEQKTYSDASGLKRIIGIASNEGSNPSDNEYVTSVEDKFKSVLSTEVVHLYQNDSVKSNPDFLNQTFASGALWLTYLGHGSGTSWPSMYRTYSVSHMSKMNNKTVVKPVVIDVACMNGRITKGYLGTSFMNVDLTEGSTQGGAAAYYGGTVNISWHPPAIMARGMAYEHMDKNFKHLGEVLMAGQMYLAANWNRKDDVVDNFEWYHLQGDPGMNVQFQPPVPPQP